MSEKTICGCDVTECGGSNEFGSKCYICPAYNPELDGRLDNQEEDEK